MDTSISGTTSISGDIYSNYTGADEVAIADGASVTVNGKFTLGTGNNSVVIGNNSTLEVAGNMDGGHWKNATLEVGKGSSITAAKVENFTIELDVDSVLNNTNATNISAINNVNANVTGVADLVLKGSDVAGAKSIMNCFGSYQEHGNLKIDDVDVVLDLANMTSEDVLGNDDPAASITQNDNLRNCLGEVKCIKTVDADEVWASLNMVNNDLVVAWGRSEAEVGAALDAFKAQTDLTLGQAIVSGDLADGYQSTDAITKKDNGKLA